MRAIEQQQDEAGRLLEGVHARLVELTRLRDDCHQQQQLMLQRADEVQHWMAQHEHLVGGRAGELRQVADKSRERAESSAAEPRPNWPAIHGWLEDAAANYTAALQQAAEDVRTYQQFVDRLSAVGQHARGVEQLLRSNTADRPRANQRYRAAAEEISELLQYETRGWRDWADLLRRVDQAGDRFTECRAVGTGGYPHFPTGGGGTAPSGAGTGVRRQCLLAGLLRRYVTRKLAAG